MVRYYSFPLSDSYSFTSQRSTAVFVPPSLVIWAPRRRAGKLVEGSSKGGVVESVITAQSLGQTWDLPTGTPVGLHGLLRSICLAPGHFSCSAWGHATRSGPGRWAASRVEGKA